MPRKKAATKKKKTSSKKTVKRTSRKKPVAKKAAKKSASRKKTAKKGSTKKKSAKKVAKKAAKKTSRKKTSKKRTASKKPAKKKAAARKKKVAKKKASKKKPSKKAAVRKVSTKKKPARKARAARRTDILTNPGAAAGPYQPRRGESYMNSGQLEHFRLLLTNWKKELMEEVDRTMLHMKDEAANFPDPNDRATQESEFGLELRTRDRERKLLRKIDSALQRIEDGSYGYCEETGEEIGLRRLEARPVATLCVEAQERRELAERQYRDRDDQYR